MKRGAERQLTRDDEPEGDSQDVEPTQGFKKADEKTLAARPVKGLPRRAGGSAAATPAFTVAAPSMSITQESAPTPKFAGFAGFGATSSGTAPFSFSAAPSTSKPTVLPPASATSSPFQFGASSSSTSATTSAFPSSISTPAVAATASSATKTFASLLASSSSAAATTETKTQPQKGHPDADSAKLQAETKYYTALRGLNVSLINALNKAVDADPFADLSTMFERYKSLRPTVKSEYDDALKTTTNASPSSSTPASSSSTTTAPVASTSFNSTRSPPTMPAPPTNFAGFGGLVASSSSSSNTTSGFKFGDTSSSSLKPTTALAFGPGASSTSDGASSTTTAPVKSAFAFPSAPPSGTGSPFVFGGGDTSRSAGSSTATSSGFGVSGAPSPSVFSSSLFSGDASSDDKSKAKAKEGYEDMDAREQEKRSGPSPFTFAAAPTTPEKSLSAFTFGTATPSKSSTSLFSAFGKPAGASGGSGSFGNPVGFQFGSPPHMLEDDGAKSPGSSAAPTKFGGFTFGAASSSGSGLSGFTFGTAAKSTDVSEGENSEATSGAGTPAPEERAATVPALEGKESIHDMEGEGEEDEQTAHEIRSKVFKLVKSERASSWQDLGIGLLKVKINNENGSRRLLLRNSSTGKVVVNFNVYQGMDATVSKNTVSFVGHEEGMTVPYRLKVKTNEQADALKKAIDREIEFVKAKASDE